ncbi:hypothetical protein VTL71DRAFT_10595 [Oculimacula yallundae]|uniref:Uncharacterized protein n=1 Tax=Oculimacula yallundae TaxID=86028 RepID=A0ABR4CTK2_9HELO
MGKANPCHQKERKGRNSYRSHIQHTYAPRLMKNAGRSLHQSNSSHLITCRTNAFLMTQKTLILTTIPTVHVHITPVNAKQVYW